LAPFYSSLFLQAYNNHTPEKIKAVKKDLKKKLFEDEKLTTAGYQKMFSNFNIQFVTSYPPEGQGLGDGSNPCDPDHGRLRAARSQQPRL
jgi:hypothetical protein